QRQNLMAYWRNAAKQVGFLRHRYLHDQIPCCSGYLATAQQEGTVLASAFLVAHSDRHMTVPVEEISAEFLGPVIDIDNQSEPIELSIDDHPVTPGQTAHWQVGQHLWLRLQTQWIALRLIAHEAHPAPNAAPQIHHNNTRLEVRLSHYQGERKTFRWKD